MMVNDKICFVHLPKTGGRFVRICLQEVLSDVNFRDNEGCLSERNVSIGAHSYPTEDKEQFTFGFVRNPLHWYASFWAHLNAPNRKRRLSYRKLYKKDINDFVRHVMTDDICFNNSRGWASDIDFEEMHEHDYGLLTHLVKKMFKYNDVTYRMETIRDDLKSMLRKVYGDIDTSPVEKRPIVGKGKKNAEDTIALYSPEIIELIRHKDKYIFENWYE